MKLRESRFRADRWVMDIPSLASAFTELTAARHAAALQIAVAARVADSQRDLGAAVVQLLQAAGEGIDTAAQSVNSATLDVVA